MTNPVQPFINHGYRMPIPRSPKFETCVSESQRGLDQGSTTHVSFIDEDIPAPYAYTVIIVPDADREALKAKFMASCNQRRWKHIHNSEVKVKVPK